MTENPPYLAEQLITYLGNKRSLLEGIGTTVVSIQQELGKDKLITFDGFSGSGVVGRYLKQFSSKVYSNDMEDYARVIAECYLSNPTPKQLAEVHRIIDDLNARAQKLTDGNPGFIRRLYSPKDESAIEAGERVFYTPENARRLDFYASEIAKLSPDLRKYLLGPLLSKASIHVNTSGVFKGFYKDSSSGKGQYGGNARAALTRIMAPIAIPYPVFSDHTTEFQVFQGDTASVVEESNPELDYTYLDPPYNQHPYGSNYFMLNLLVNYEEPAEISSVSGIPTDWNRSSYNKKNLVLAEMKRLVEALNSKVVVISYNNEGFVSQDEFRSVLEAEGQLSVVETQYNTFRGSRNLGARSKHVTELLYVLKRY